MKRILQLHVWGLSYYIFCKETAVNMLNSLEKTQDLTEDRRPKPSLSLHMHFPVREKSGNFEQTGKVRENHTKYWKTEGISEKNYLLFFNDILNELCIIC